MSAPLTVIIPTIDAADRLSPTLAALTEGVVDGLVRELVIADGGSTDGIEALAEGVGARLVRAPRGRGTQLHAAARSTETPWLLFLHADTVPAPGWSAAVAAHMALEPDKAGWFRLAFDSSATMARVTAGWANLRSRVFGLPYGDQGLLIPRALYDETGGYRSIPLMEDVALARAIGRRRMAAIEAVATTSAGRFVAEGWFRRGWRNLTTLALYFAGVSPERLARRYERR
ncbi:TIGR04283 family arsenosugar biosynthesis glycosyltransferase [Paralimibaculum aggregatum]|uniref:TIGR04283 family arsenosugar biosynthesis glycosyltransferase n=1 Tax=Paralimibaculum aggregatum TaxID=3036245 RepID=A0ABQ6LQE4_9RHOB|nr:TIGR04283 family arsenosugar biosynthesis glycosyltransferase [Limibaculum sp. NKW23]GMG84924.1 TIGR04283 family arsenosugar biosynthesis glycosyltransferase [Limibaculum sp. NKW23]